LRFEELPQILSSLERILKEISWRKAFTKVNQSHCYCKFVIIIVVITFLALIFFVKSYRHGRSPFNFGIEFTANS
jgi:t-SNARE complex subunit (syntaxin)